MNGSASVRARVNGSADWPLLCKQDGLPLNKTDVVDYLRELSRLEGRDILRITGHSARVTGAMRMAYGQFPI